MKRETKQQSLDSLLSSLSVGFILLISYFTYFDRYPTPAVPFWDENFYIPVAQKYLNGVFFMHVHPPLGEILIALGEKIVHANGSNDQFLHTDVVKSLPEKFSLAGYRLIPVLLAWWTAPLICGIFLLITRSHVLSILLSSLYVFDNALIVHLRGAMLEGPFLFFIGLTILCFLLLLEWQHRPRYFSYTSLLLGMAFAAATTTKATGLILLLLLPALIFYLWSNWKKLFISLSLALFGFILVFVTVWQVHFSLASQVIRFLPNEGYYEASAEYRQILKEGHNRSLLSFPVMLRDSLRYGATFHGSYLKLNLCSPTEYGSPPMYWPLGARAINYRWETADSKIYKYLYLQSNPVVWAVGLVGVFLATSLLLASLFLPLREPLRHRPALMTFLVLYAGYMLAVNRIPRVMFLYHYFPPLLFSFFLFGISLMEIQQLGRWRLNQIRKSSILLFLVVWIVISYQFYRPLTYYEPIADQAFRQRMIFPLWDLRCINCKREG